MQIEHTIGNPFFELSEVDSTNNYAMRQAQAHLAEHGTTWFAQYQTAGKGQRGKPWNATPGTNIMMSVLLTPTFLPIENQFLLNVAVALACFDLFNVYTVGNTCIKWPNDIYWKDRKAGGILIENVIQGKEWKYSIAGIGININQTFFPSELPNPVSLKQITGRTYDPVELARQLCKYLEHRWLQLCGTNKTSLLSDYCAYLYKKEQSVKFRKENVEFDAVVKSVNARGELIVEKNEDGAELALTFGSVKWIIR